MMMMIRRVGVLSQDLLKKEKRLVGKGSGVAKLEFTSLQRRFSSIQWFIRLGHHHTSVLSRVGGEGVALLDNDKSIDQAILIPLCAQQSDIAHPSSLSPSLGVLSFSIMSLIFSITSIRSVEKDDDERRRFLASPFTC